MNLTPRPATAAQALCDARDGRLAEFVDEGGSRYCATCAQPLLPADVPAEAAEAPLTRAEAEALVIADQECGYYGDGTATTPEELLAQARELVTEDMLEGLGESRLSDAYRLILADEDLTDAVVSHRGEEFRVVGQIGDQLMLQRADGYCRRAPAAEVAR
jgi:hypothetical protein